MEIDIKPIMEELSLIRGELSEIKNAIPDKDMFLTAEETKLIEESHKHEKAGKLISSKDFRKKLGI